MNTKLCHIGGFVQSADHFRQKSVYFAGCWDFFKKLLCGLLEFFGIFILRVAKNIRYNLYVS